MVPTQDWRMTPGSFSGRHLHKVVSSRVDRVTPSTGTAVTR